MTDRSNVIDFLLSLPLPAQAYEVAELALARGIRGAITVRSYDSPSPDVLLEAVVGDRVNGPWVVVRFPRDPEDRRRYEEALAGRLADLLLREM